MLKKNYSVLALLAVCFLVILAASAFALSDKEYKQMMKNSNFAQADKALNQAWKNARNSLPESDFENLKRNQNSWIKSGRDNEAKPLLKKMSRVQAYTNVTNARIKYINDYVQQILDSDSEDYGEEFEITDDNDLPDDIPDDVPSSSSSKKSSAPSKKEINISSPDEASELLSERLIDLEKIQPSEELTFETLIQIDGEQCWEFSASFNFNETGRYAISQSGKIYEYDNENFVPVN